MKRVAEKKAAGKKKKDLLKAGARTKMLESLGGDAASRHAANKATVISATETGKGKENYKQRIKNVGAEHPELVPDAHEIKVKVIN